VSFIERRYGELKIVRSKVTRVNPESRSPFMGDLVSLFLVLGLSQQNVMDRENYIPALGFDSVQMAKAAFDSS